MSVSTLEVVDLDQLLEAEARCQLATVLPNGPDCGKPAAWLLIATCGHRFLVCADCKKKRDARSAAGVPVRCSGHGLVDVDIRWVPL